jgi:uncharacterized membrane protein
MQNPNDSLFALEFDHQASAYIVQSAKWSRFLAILWFVLCGIFVIACLITIVTTIDRQTTLTTYDMGGQVALGVTLLWFIVILVGNIFRYRFAIRAIRAIRDTDQQMLVSSLGQLRLYTKYCGIISIIGIVLFIAGTIINAFADTSAL